MEKFKKQLIRTKNVDTMIHKIKNIDDGILN